ncbi:MAG TPA: TonB family protein [Steroidobacter sp.]|jgi:TonB family protein|nr:TonB family protein [Steroidobacter sp.]
MNPPLRVAALLACSLVGWNGSLAAAPEIPSSQQEYWAQFDRRDWTAAITAAEKLVAAAREDAAREPLRLAKTLSLLGDAQFGAGDYVSAEASYKESLQLLEQHGAPMSADLLAPLRGLGYSFAISGRHAEAIPLLDRALLVGRRNFGLFDIGQQGILRQLASSLTRVGRAADAERHMDYLLRVGERTYGRDDPQLAPILCEIGAWYAETGEFIAARERYRQALDLVEKALGRSSMAAVEPLRGLARTYTQELFYSTLRVRTDREPALGLAQREGVSTLSSRALRSPADADGSSNDREPIDPRRLSPDGEKALERALKVIESKPDAPRDAYVETLVQMGDWRQIKQQTDRAMSLYRRAAALVQIEGSTHTSEQPGRGPESLLSSPVRVYYLTPWLAARNLTLPVELVDETFVEVEFTVTKDGRVSGARVVEANGTTRQAAEALEAIRGSRFRPRFVAGEPVDTPNVVNREVFRRRKQASDDSTL